MTRKIQYLMWLLAGISFCFGVPVFAQASADKAAPYADLVKDLAQTQSKSFAALDMQKIVFEDSLRDFKGVGGMRFAVARDVAISPATHGQWTQQKSGMWLWQYGIKTPDAVHLNFGFRRFQLPVGAELVIAAGNGKAILGPYTSENHHPSGQLWTPILPGRMALLQLKVPEGMRDQVQLELMRVGHGYRGFGYGAKYCKSGACNMDVACLDNADAWNRPRRSVAAIAVGASYICTGSLVNNTAGDRRLLFATASHCAITDANVAQVLAYFNYESPTCRTPGSGASGTALPKPTTTLAGLDFLTATRSPFDSSGPTGPTNQRTDWTLLELTGSPSTISSLNLHWAGWDRSATGATCITPGDASSTVGLCASIHHPAVDEKRITFVQADLISSQYATATAGTHWQALWDPNPPVLSGLTSPVTPGVTEPGSSGSPLYNAQQRLVGVLSGGPSSCGATGASLSDFYGKLATAYSGTTIAGSGGAVLPPLATYLDPISSGATTVDGVDLCTAPAAPSVVNAAAVGSNRIDVTWGAVGGVSTYRIYRSNGACPGDVYTQIGEVTSGTTYSDTTASGGTTYSYKVTAVSASSCESAQSSCSSATAAGVCTTPPSFSGLASASSAGTTQCGVNLSWGTAMGNCGGGGSTLRYNIYRSTSSGFTPGTGNLYQSCLSSTTAADAAVTSGIPYYYVVRAEDTAASGGTGRCGGREETNTVEQAATPSTVSVSFSDNVESGGSSWSVNGTGAGTDFAITRAHRRSLENSWGKDIPAAVSDRQLQLNSGIILAPGSSATLEFYHRYLSERGDDYVTGTPFDGGVLEYSINGGGTWVDILAGTGSVPANAGRITTGGYVGAIDTDFSNPLGGRQAWSGTQLSFGRVAVNLADFAGQAVLFRFRLGSDRSVSSTLAGWWIDDISVYTSGACSAGSVDAIFANGFE
jgi:lysyl endopeptidase